MINLDNYIGSFEEARKKKLLKTMDHIPAAKEYSGTYFINVGGESYFLKVASSKEIFYKMYAELVSEEFSRLVNINSTKSNIVLFNYGNSKIKDYRYALMSKDYRKDNYTIYSNKEMYEYYADYLESKGLYNKYFDDETNFDSLDLIWDSYYYHYIDYKDRDAIVENKVKEQVKRYIYRFYVMDRDFHLGNGETLDSEELSLTEEAPMFDMDETFNPLYSYRNNSMKGFGLDDPYEDFNEFLKYSDEGTLSLAKNMHDVLTKDALISTIKEVEREKDLKMPDEYKMTMIALYSNHYDKVDEIIKENIKNKTR